MILLALAAFMAAALPSPAAASKTQLSMFEEDPHLLTEPVRTMQTLHWLGVQMVRMDIAWYYVAPQVDKYRRPRNFDAENPAAYPARNWTRFDNIVTAAHNAGIQLEFDVAGPAPLWATGSGAPHPRTHQWEPSPGAFFQFVVAVGRRYSGTYKPRHASRPLPRVSAWSVWNEPDYGPSLAPQGKPGNLFVEYSPYIYRGLVDSAWHALHKTGHGSDTFLFGEVAPRGYSYWGIFSGMPPLVFLRALYCVDSRFRPLHGQAATDRGCPSTAAGSRAFASAHPALFNATGFADHPYMRWYAPNHEQSPDPVPGTSSTSQYSSLGVIGQLTSTLDRLQTVYGSHKQFPIYDTEDGYITSPPKKATAKTPYLSQPKAAYYINWLEYVEWRNPRLATYNQYLLFDPLRATPANGYGGFASGLRGNQGGLKPAYYTYRMPLYMPVSSAHTGQQLEVWGCVRGARFALIDHHGPQTAYLQFAPGHSSHYTTLLPIVISDPSNCYFDVRLPFATSGSLRLTYTYPGNDPSLPKGLTIYSQHLPVSVH